MRGGIFAFPPFFCARNTLPVRKIADNTNSRSLFGRDPLEISPSLRGKIFKRPKMYLTRDFYRGTLPSYTYSAAQFCFLARRFFNSTRIGSLFCLELFYKNISEICRSPAVLALKAYLAHGGQFRFFAGPKPRQDR